MPAVLEGQQEELLLTGSSSWFSAPDREPLQAHLPGQTVKDWRGGLVYSWLD